MDMHAQAAKLTKTITDFGIDGVGPLDSASELAQEYVKDASYESLDARVTSLIRWEASKNFGAGFVNGLGGIVTLPATVPASLFSSWVVQARLVAAIAVLYGHDLKSDRVRTMVLLTLIGDSATSVMREVGVKCAHQVALSSLKKLPGHILCAINKAVGFRLLTKFGEKGLINLVKVVPLFGGIVGGSVDAATCTVTGRIAKASFKRAA